MTSPYVLPIVVIFGNIIIYLIIKTLSDFYNQKRQYEKEMMVLHSDSSSSDSSLSDSSSSDSNSSDSSSSD